MLCNSCLEGKNRFSWLKSKCPSANLSLKSFSNTWIPWNLSFRYIHCTYCTGQFTPKLKANAEPCLLSSLVWIGSGVVVSQQHLESFLNEINCNGMTSFIEFMPHWLWYFIFQKRNDALNLYFKGNTLGIFLLQNSIYTEMWVDICCAVMAITMHYFIGQHTMYPNALPKMNEWMRVSG